MNAKLVLPGIAIACAALAACGSSGSGGSSSSPSASATGTKTIQQACQEVDRVMTDHFSADPTQEDIKKAYAGLESISAQSNAEAQAAIAPLAASVKKMEGVDMSGESAPPAFQEFVSQADAFKNTCAKNNVTFTAQPGGN